MLNRSTFVAAATVGIQPIGIVRTETRPMALFAADETRGVGKGIAFDRALVQSMLGGATFVANTRFHFALLLLFVG